MIGFGCRFTCILVNSDTRTSVSPKRSPAIAIINPLIVRTSHILNTTYSTIYANKIFENNNSFLPLLQSMFGGHCPCFNQRRNIKHFPIPWHKTEEKIKGHIRIIYIENTVIFKPNLSLFFFFFDFSCN